MLRRAVFGIVSRWLRLTLASDLIYHVESDVNEIFVQSGEMIELFIVSRLLAVN